jgi:hypothetical protein
MIFSDPDDRRALRSAVNAAMALIGLSFVGWIIWLLAGEPGFLFYIAIMLLAINWTREIFAGVENVARAVKAKLGKDGVELSIGEQDPDNN